MRTFDCSYEPIVEIVSKYKADYLLPNGWVAEIKQKLDSAERKRLIDVNTSLSKFVVFVLCSETDTNTFSQWKYVFNYRRNGNIISGKDAVLWCLNYGIKTIPYSKNNQTLLRKFLEDLKNS